MDRRADPLADAPRASERLRPPLTPARLRRQIVDYDQLHSGRSQQAMFVGLWAFLPKLASIAFQTFPTRSVAAMPGWHTRTLTFEPLSACASCSATESADVPVRAWAMAIKSVCA